MNITFLIGNGFDRNLGLNTTYSDFVKKYKNTPCVTEALRDFRCNIHENEELWSSAELALGQYTKRFDNSTADSFSECHVDFCEHLAAYLKKQETRIDYIASEEKIRSAFSNLNKLTQNFPTQERAVLDGLYQRHTAEGIYFNFINYNYTGTLDQCLDIVKKDTKVLGIHRHNTTIMPHEIREICHVHGTVEKEMVFGVNDDSQIGKVEIFDCENGDLYKNMLVKRQANASYLENTDDKAAKLIQNSHIIYVYGMSIGDTDKLWWDRICTWLSASSDHHLLIQKYETPPKGVTSIKYQLFERECRKDFSRHSSLDKATKGSIEKRIHVTGENIFEDIKNIANPLKTEFENRFDEIIEISSGVR